MRLIDADALKGSIDCGHLRPPTELCFSELDVCNMIDKAPAMCGWIPCSERLPDDMTYVLTTIHIPGREPVVRSGVYENGLFHNDNGDVWKATDREVLAWLPLPEPYEAS